MNLLLIQKMFLADYAPPLPRIKMPLNFLLISYMILCVQYLSTNLLAQTKDSASSASDRVVTSGKQNFENQLVMLELQLLCTDTPTSRQLKLAEHLKLADPQKEKLDQINQGLQKDIGAIGADGSLKITERARKFQSLLDDTERQLSEVLLPDQQKRLRQIALQSLGTVPGQAGLSVFKLLGNPNFRSYLEISEPTAKRLRSKIQEENQRLQNEIAKLKSQSQEAVLNILADEEKQRLADQLGEPFEFGKLSDSKGPGPAENEDK